MIKAKCQPLPPSHSTMPSPSPLPSSHSTMPSPSLSHLVTAQCPLFPSNHSAVLPFPQLITAQCPHTCWSRRGAFMSDCRMGAETRNDAEAGAPPPCSDGKVPSPIPESNEDCEKGTAYTQVHPTVINQPHGKIDYFASWHDFLAPSTILRSEWCVMQSLFSGVLCEGEEAAMGGWGERHHVACEETARLLVAG